MTVTKYPDPAVTRNASHLKSVSYAGHDAMTIAKDARLESVLARDKTVAAQIELYTSTNLDATISGAFVIMGNRNRTTTI